MINPTDSCPSASTTLCLTIFLPVVVVTAKELTLREKERLRGQIQSLMVKGEFMSDELAGEVQALVK